MLSAYKGIIQNKAKMTTDLLQRNLTSVNLTLESFVGSY